MTELDNLAFREEVRAFIRAALPADMAARNRNGAHHSREDVMEWARRLASRGWSTPNWPKEYGGPGWSAAERQIFEEEAALAGAPALHIQSVFLAGPLIYAFGSEAQKARYLPAIQKGEELWAQGFSEPNAGSDLASLTTRAVRDGDGYVLNGQKIWTSDADWCDQMFCLARTGDDAKPQRAISMFLFSLKLPGISVRPIPLIDGSTALCQVFFDNVRLPADALLGEEGLGWTYAKYLLDNERTTTAEAPRNRRYLTRVWALACEARDGAGRLIDNEAFAARLAKLELDFVALEAGAQQALAAPGDPSAAPLPSVLKLKGTELMQAAQDMQVEALGPYGVLLEDAELGPASGEGVVEDFLFRRAATIYGGSSEIQRGIIAKILLRGARIAPPPGDEEETMLRDAARRYVARAQAGDARAQLAGFADLGWLGVGLPNAEEGVGVSAAAAILEEIARAPASTPLLGALIAAHALASANANDARDAAVAGERVFAFAHEEAAARGRSDFIETEAKSVGGGWILSGKKTLVLNGGVADALIVSARAEGDAALFLIDPNTEGVELRACRLFDGRPSADAVLTGARVGKEARLAVGASAIEAAIRQGALLACAEALGAMDEALWITRDYVMTRRQFGQTLSSFQSLQHRLADMYAEVEIARAMLRRALAAGENGPVVSAAKARIGQAAAFVGGQTIQLHGGIGMTAEYVAGNYFKRLRVLDALFGSAQHHFAVFRRGLVPPA
ncbi:MAG: acyl-CoA dehydrogenase family protein [Hyphomonadaceae bacterium]